MNQTRLKQPEFEPGDVVSVQGTAVISRLIQWVTRSTSSHTAMICCRLSNGNYMIIETIAKGVLIRPLSVYQGKKIEVYRVSHRYAKVYGQAIVLATLDEMGSSYAFHKLLYLGLVLTPRRVLNRRLLFDNLQRDHITYEPKPKGIYQKFCYYLTEIISTVTLMRYWTSILRSLSKDKWLVFTERLAEQISCVKISKGGISFEEFVQIVEVELRNYEDQKVEHKGYSHRR